MENDMDKIKIAFGKCQVGDTLRGKKIISFGKSWIENKADKSYFQGQLWEPCKCREEPVYLPTLECERCINRRYGKPEEVHYAYLEQ